MKHNSRLLIDESPLQVLPTLAVKLGLNEAIILQQIHYWIDINRKKGVEQFEGRFWTYNTYAEWQKQFPWWSIDTVRRAIVHLEQMGVLITNQQKAQTWDHTKYYAIDYDRLEQLDIHDDSNLPTSNEANSDNLNLTETTTETTTEKYIYSEIFSKLDSMVGCITGGNSDIETAEIMLDEYGVERFKRAAAWAKDKHFTNMRTALRSMNTSLANGGFQDEVKKGPVPVSRPVVYTDAAGREWR